MMLQGGAFMVQGTAAPSVAKQDLIDMFGGEKGFLCPSINDAVADGKIWQDDAGTTAASADGESVGRLDDYSGNGLHLTQGTESKKPTLKQDPSGDWYLQYDGGDSLSAAIGAMPQPSTYVAAGKFDVTSGFPDIVDTGDGTTGSTRNQLGIRSSNFESYAKNTLSHSAADTLEHVFLAEFDEVGSEIHVDSSIVTGNPGNAGPPAGSYLALGSLNNGTSEFITGRVYGLLDINRLLTSDEKDDAKQYMADNSGASL